jgi:lipid A 3-O-deacylase
MRSRAIPILLLLLLSPAGVAQGMSKWELFGQAGWAESDVRSYAIGAQRPLPWRGRLMGATFRTYTEVTLSRWVANEPGAGRAHDFTQFGAAPVLRIQPVPSFPGLFLDLGVGAYLVTPIYQHQGKRFGSAFNFGDQIGLGLRMGRRHGHELSLRVQHFSNGGIRQPNPGENFLQARLLVRLRD